MGERRIVEPSRREQLIQLVKQKHTHYTFVALSKMSDDELEKLSGETNAVQIVEGLGTVREARTQQHLQPHHRGTNTHRKRVK